jgi:hypothetical protein
MKSAQNITARKRIEDRNLPVAKHDFFVFLSIETLFKIRKLNRWNAKQQLACLVIGNA